MAVSTMQKVHIFAHVAEENQLIRRLHDLGVVQVDDFGERHPEESAETSGEHDIDALRDLENRLDRFRGASEYLASYAAAEETRISLSAEEYGEIVRDAAADRIVEECATLEEARNGVLSELGRLGTLRDQLVPWAGLEIPREELRTLRTTATILGTVPSERAHALEVELEEVSDAVHLERVGEHEGTTHFVLFHRNEDTGRIADALRAAECSEASLPSFQGTVREELERIRAEISAKERERAEVEARSAELVPHRRELLVLIDHLSDCVAEEVIRSRFARTTRSMLIEGWMEGENFAQAKAELEAEFETVRVMEAESMPGEEPPTEFANAPAIRPFEVVTDLYGRPKYGDLDPTAITAPFFAVFFGLCLTDGGYGLLLTLICLFALKRMKLGKGTRNLVWTLLICGLFTIAAGILTGGYFGVNISNLDSSFPLVRLAQAMKVFDPIDDAMTFFTLAIWCGVVQVSFGFGLKLYADARMGRTLRGVLVNVPWIVATFGLGIVMTNFLIPLAPEVVSAGQKIVLAGLGGVLLFTGYGERNPVAWLARGLGGVYGITGVFGDILSYSRLVALGLATAVVAGVIDILAGIILNIPYGIGWVMFILLVVVGHTAYMAIAGLGAFVHTSRLSFVEFFSKFYEAGGRPFRPFRKENRYIVVS